MKRLFITLLILSSGISLHSQDRKIPVETAKPRTDDWHTEMALTLSGLDGFKPASAPQTDMYGGYTFRKFRKTGFFRTEKADGRWWIVTPKGHPFISVGINTLVGGQSSVARKARDERFGSRTGWYSSEREYLRSIGINTAGAWSSYDVITASSDPIPYCVIFNVLKKYMRGKYPDSKDISFVFDPDLKEFIEKELSRAEKYKGDSWCLGYFVDNELPWRNTMLKHYLRDLPEDNPNRRAAVKWMERHNAKEITPELSRSFAAYVFDYYQNMIYAALRRHDPDHMYLGCRFNIWKHELSNPELFECAAKYFDIISINHYGKWEPLPELFADWEKWSGRPQMVTEFYTKGMDSGMPNNTGGGWNVRTQKDRGIFYQNFVLGLLKCPSCVGWHWFQYQDNDPAFTKADISNKDSNKGIVNLDFEHYSDLTEEMKALNLQIPALIKYFGKQASLR